MKSSRKSSAARVAAAIVLAIAMVGCVGDDEGGGNDPTPPSPPAPPATSQLAVAANGGGRVVSQPAGIDCGAQCSAEFAQTASVTLTATPDTGRIFSGWGGDCSGSAATCTVTMQTARTVTAGFNVPPPASFALSVTVTGNGTVRSQPAGIDCGSTCSASFPADGMVTLTATPATGQIFSGWGGACAGAGTACTVTLSQARSVSAAFAAAPAVQRTLTLNLAGSGSVRSQPAGIDCGSACSARFGDGASVVLTAAPAAGQRFTAWSGACTGTSETCTVVMSTDRTVAAAFAAAPVAPSWGTAELLENNADYNVGRTLAAISANGDAMVMWEQGESTPAVGTRKIFSRRYVAGQGWLPAAVVPGISTTSSSATLLAGRLLMDAGGTATWLRPNLETRRHTIAGGWGTPFLPPTLDAGSLSAAVMDASGAISAVTSGSDVYSITLPAGATTWLPWVRVDASGSLTADDADVALSADGTAVAIWRERNPGDNNFSLKAARYRPQGGWQTPQTIDDSFDNVQSVTPPKVAMDNAGNAIAVWHQGASIYYNVLSPASGWGAATAVDSNGVSPGFLAEVTLAMTGSGRAVVTWRSGIYALKAMQYTPGSGFSAPVTLAPYALGVGLGMDAEGNAVVVYAAPDAWPQATTGLDVYTRRLTWGAAWSTAAPIEPLDGRGAFLVSAFNRGGQGVAAWVRDDVAGRDSRTSFWANVLR